MRSVQLIVYWFGGIVTSYKANVPVDGPTTATGGLIVDGTVSVVRSPVIFALI